MKDDQLSRMSNASEMMHTKLAIIKHSHALIYQQYVDERRKWQNEKTSLEKTNTQLMIQFDTQRIIVDEYEVVCVLHILFNRHCFQRLKSSLDKDDNEQKRRLVETSRQMTRLRINEAIMIRKYRTLEIDAKHIEKVFEVND